MIDASGVAFSAVLDPLLALLRAALPVQETKTPAVEKPKRKYAKRTVGTSAKVRRLWNKFPAKAIEPEGRFQNSKVDRNKKCKDCGDSFYDESKRNRRTMCGDGECKREAAKKAPRTPRDLDDRVSPNAIAGL